METEKQIGLYKLRIQTPGEEIAITRERGFIVRARALRSVHISGPGDNRDEDLSYHILADEAVFITTTPLNEGYNGFRVADLDVILEITSQLKEVSLEQTEEPL